MTSPVPQIPNSMITGSPAASPVRIALPDYIQIDESTIPVELMEQLIFEKIGGQELINISRNDTLAGQRIAYQPISNVSDIFLQFNSSNIIFMSDSADSYFKNFNIALDDKLAESYSATGQILPSITTDAATGNIIIDFINLNEDYQIEIQSLQSGEVFDDTIY